MSQTRTHAIVIGGSMAGLLTARVLSEFFTRVTILERDTLPEAPAYRNGTPQVRHLHALLAKGQRIMNDLFPGLNDELRAAGAPELQWGINTKMVTTGGELPHFDSGIRSNLISRTTLEHLVRQRIYDIENIKFCTQVQVEKPLLDKNKRTVVGVELMHRRTKEHERLMADLVVDASGRGSKTPEWFESLGYDAPDETQVNAFVGYATRWYEVSDTPRDFDSIAIQANAPVGNYRAGGVFYVEGNRMVVTLVGSNQDYPPTDEDGFLAFAESLSDSSIYEAIQEATPVSKIYGYRRTQNRLRHYETLAKRPENFIIVGDAVCAFNPLYGQGMTVAAMEAMALREMLADYNIQQLKGFATAFQTKLAQVVRTTWELATAEDLRYPLTEGSEPGWKIRFMQKYTDWVAFAMSHDKVVTAGFLEVWNLEQESMYLVRPNILMRVIWHNFRHKKQAAGQTPELHPAHQA